MLEGIGLFGIIVFFILIATVGGIFTTVNQGTISVVTMFGKYRRIMYPGLNFKIPFLETIYKKVSIQNRSVELEFQAVTIDQANVYFKSMLLYSVQNEHEETIQKVAFKFISDKDLMQALVRTIEGNIRSFVATKRQAEILAANGGWEAVSKRGDLPYSPPPGVPPRRTRSRAPTWRTTPRSPPSNSRGTFSRPVNFRPALSILHTLHHS